MSAINGRLPGMMLIAASALALTGCDNVGPAAINFGRTSYNNAIQRTDKEQMLLNLVRVRYGDTLTFLQVNQASSSIEVDLSGSITGNYGLKTNGHPGAYNTGIFGGSTTYSEHPVITYIPLQGETFANQLMVPIDLKSILMLCQSDWPIDLVLRVCVQRIGSLLNFPPTMKTDESSAGQRYGKFLRLAAILREFQYMGRLDIGLCAEYSGIDKKQSQMSAIMFDIEDVNTSEKENKFANELLAEMQKILELDSKARTFVLTDEADPTGKDRFTTVTRSVMSSMFYACHGVMIPEDDRPKVFKYISKEDSPYRLNWQALMSKLITVHNSPTPPLDAYVAVLYNGKWFYIDEKDIDSKSTFVLLTQLFQIRAVGSSQGGMLLSLPIK